MLPFKSNIKIQQFDNKQFKFVHFQLPSEYVLHEAIINKHVSIDLYLYKLKLRIKAYSCKYKKSFHLQNKVSPNKTILLHFIKIFVSFLTCKIGKFTFWGLNSCTGFVVTVLFHRANVRIPSFLKSKVNKIKLISCHKFHLVKLIKNCAHEYIC